MSDVIHNFCITVISSSNYKYDLAFSLKLQYFPCHINSQSTTSVFKYEPAYWLFKDEQTDDF